LAKPNYSYEKRQRELAKKQKKEEKLRRKAAGLPAQDDEPGGEDAGPAAGQDEAQAPSGEAGGQQSGGS
jgi:hypothetical protein